MSQINTWLKYIFFYGGNFKFFKRYFHANMFAPLWDY